MRNPQEQAIYDAAFNAARKSYEQELTTRGIITRWPILRDVLHNAHTQDIAQCQANDAAEAVTGTTNLGCYDEGQSIAISACDDALDAVYDQYTVDHKLTN